MRTRDNPPDPQAQSRFTALLAPHLGDELQPRSTAPSASVLASFNPGRRAIKPLIAVAVAVAAVAAFLAWRSQPVSRVIAATPAVALVASAAPSRDPSEPPAVLVVAVAGRVRHPGLIKLAPGARIADALDAAGGVLPGTDLSFVNLAQKVVDGQLIVIGKSGPMGGGAGTGGGSNGGGGPAGGSLIDLNTASATELDTLPGIGPSLAGHIIDYRTAHGPFHSIDELRNVSGIGDAKFSEIKDLVTV